MSMYGRRRQVTIRWKGAVLTWLAVVALAVPVAGAATLLLGAAHVGDPRVPDLGWLTCYRLVLLAWIVSWLVNADITVDE